MNLAEREEYGIKPGSVVQIAPEHDQSFGGCLLLVTEVKSWGVQGAVRVPGAGADAHYRVKWEAVEYVGEAIWLPESLVKRLDETAPALVPAAFPLQTRVSWQEGRTGRAREGVIEAIHQQDGWPAEYEVRPLRRDGTLGKQVQKRHHSELTREN